MDQLSKDKQFFTIILSLIKTGKCTEVTPDSPKAYLKCHICLDLSM